jgi:hypothetical protein
MSLSLNKENYQIRSHRSKSKRRKLSKQKWRTSSMYEMHRLKFGWKENTVKTTWQSISERIRENDQEWREHEKTCSRALELNDKTEECLVTKRWMTMLQREGIIR